MRFLKTQNKISSLVLFFIFIMVFVYSHAQEKITYWENGKIKNITNHDEDGKKTGYWENYSQSGQLEKSGSYEKGKKYGTWYEYYYDGTNKKSTSYYNGSIEEFKTYYDNGRLMASGRFDNYGKKHGRWMQNYDNWQQKLEGDYDHGKKNGPWKYYTKSGALFKIENYKEGIRDSKWEGNNGNSNAYVNKKDEVEYANAVEATAGVVEAAVEIDVSKKVEEVLESDVSSEIAIAEAVDAATSGYYGSKQNGEWKFYNENGKLVEVGTYLNGRKDGKWIDYYANGQQKKEQVWKQGKLMEVTAYFDEKGKPLDIGTIKSGSGTVKEYGSDNKLISTVEYSYGTELDWNNWNQLNTLAWNVYENQTDREVVNKALKWVKRSIELEKNYYNTDTYAALLYKSGKYKQALEVAKEAIHIAKQDKEDYSATNQLVEQIKRKIK